MRKPPLNLSELRAIELVYEAQTEVSAEDIVAFTKIWNFNLGKMLKSYRLFVKAVGLCKVWMLNSSKISKLLDKR